MKSKLLLGLFALCVWAATATAQKVETVLSGFFEPFGVAVDPHDNTYWFTDSVGNRVYSYNPTHDPQQVVLGDGGLFSNPQGIAYSVARNSVIVADTDNHRIVIISAANTSLVTIVGGTAGANDGTAADAQFRYPYAVAVDSAGNIYVADNQNNSLRKIDAANAVTTLATGFNRPSGVAVSEAAGAVDKIYVADTLNGSVAVLDALGARLPAISGFVNPRGLLWVGGDTGLVVSDTIRNNIRSVGPGKTSGTLFAGSSIGASGSVNATLLGSTFNSPIGLALDNNGFILVADLRNNSIRSVQRVPLLLPKLSPIGDTYINDVFPTVTNLVTEIKGKAVARYTLDGKDPTPLSPDIKAVPPVLVGPVVSLKVRAFSPDFASSEILSNSYTFVASAPIFTPPGGSFANNTNITITSLTKGAISVLFTNFTAAADGTWVVSAFNSDVVGPWTNTAASATNYGKSGFLTAIVKKPGYYSSVVVSNEFKYTVTDPGNLPLAGIKDNLVTIGLTNVTDFAEYRYTLDGTLPNLASPALPAPVGAKIPPPFDIDANVVDTKGVTTNAIFTVVGFKDGYAKSAPISAVYSFRVGDPQFSILGGTFNNNTNIAINTTTKGGDVSIRYTISKNGSVPTLADPVWVNDKGPIDGSDWGKSGVLVVKGFKSGYAPSAAISNKFVFEVTLPGMTVGGGVFTNDLTLSFTNSTADTVFKSTNNAATPATSALSTITLAGNADGKTNNVISVVGTKDGYSDTAPVKETYIFNVDNPTITAPELPADQTTYKNEVVVTFNDKTKTSQMLYTLDGKSPTNSATSISGGTTGTLTITTTNKISVVGRRSNYNDSSIIVTNFPVQLGKPALTPATGYFPSGQLVTATKPRSDATLRYTVDDSDPTKDSVEFPAAGLKLDALGLPATDLRHLKVRAFAPNTIPSDVVSGEIATENSIGFPGDAFGGVGSTIVLPMVLNLKSNVTVRSIQFTAHVTPDTGAPNLAVGALSPLSVLFDQDFVSLADGTDRTGVATMSWDAFSIPGAGKVTSAMSIIAVGTNANFKVSNFGVLALAKITIPAVAKEGDKYLIQIVNATATSDGQQKAVDLVSLATRTVTVKNIKYLVGDTAPGPWYNAGDFGDGKLSNADVNNVFYASLGVRVPFAGTDLFDAMDAYPEDSANAPGGDGQIRFLDYQKIYSRSLNKETKNWKRVRNASGALITEGPINLGAPNLAAEAIPQNPPGWVWFSEALLAASPVNGAVAGQTVDIPVYLKTLPGQKISGMQFRAVVQPMGISPALTEAAVFVPDASLPVPSTLTGLPLNEVAASWNLGAFNPPLEGRVQLGVVHMRVPRGAGVGGCYKLAFPNLDGSPDASTQYNMESRPACVWVEMEDKTPQDPITDEWRLRFFGSLASPNAKADADPDGDGVPNWKEFLAGTDPTKAESRLRLGTPGFRLEGGKKSLVLPWLSAPGKIYVIESAPDVSSGNWTVVATGVIGDGSLKEFVQTAGPGGEQFYRIRLLE